jgi:hypothetical protein
MLDPQTTALLSQFGIDAATIDSVVAWTIYLTIASVIAAIPTGMIARRKGRSVSAWVILALCVPVLPLLIIWLLPDAKRK